MTTFKNYPDLANYIFAQQGLKIETVYVNDFNYSNHAIYLNRIASCNPNKIKLRILKQGDKVKNCLKITFNPDLYDKQYLEYLINSRIKLLKLQFRGTCQTFLPQSGVKQILSGVIGPNNQPTIEAKNLLNVDLSAINQRSLRQKIRIN